MSREGAKEAKVITDELGHGFAPNLRPFVPSRETLSGLCALRALCGENPIRSSVNGELRKSGKGGIHRGGAEDGEGSRFFAFLRELRVQIRPRNRPRRGKFLLIWSPRTQRSRR